MSDIEQKVAAQKRKLETLKQLRKALVDARTALQQLPKKSQATV